MQHFLTFEGIEEDINALQLSGKLISHYDSLYFDSHPVHHEGREILERSS